MEGMAKEYGEEVKKVEDLENAIEAIERVLYLRSCSINDIKNYNRQLREMGKKHKELIIDFTNGKVMYEKDKIKIQVV